MPKPRLRRRALVAATAMALGVGMLAGLAPTSSLASSHREAPLVSADPQVDNTDVYAFVSPDAPSTVTLISNWVPFEEPSGGPNFYPWAEHTNYDIKLDNNGDAVADVIFRWKFTNHYRSGNTFLYNTGVVTGPHDADLNFYQTYDLNRITPGGTQHLLNDAPVAPSDVGDASIPNYKTVQNKSISGILNGNGKSYVGQADDPFFLDLRVFDLLYGTDLSEVGDDTLAGFNVNTMAIQVPKTNIAKSNAPGAHPIVGIWSTASRPNMRVQTTGGGQSYTGDLVQVSRLGNPLVNEVVVPVGKKDRFNASRPLDDGQFLPAVQDPELPHLLNAVYGLPVPDSDPSTPGVQRSDLISVFLTGVGGLNQPSGVRPSEQLRLNMSIPPCSSQCSRLGVIGGDNAGYPNGRRLRDDVIDIALQVVEGELIGNPNDLGDAVNGNDVNFQGAFPYVGLPHSGSDPSPH